MKINYKHTLQLHNPSSAKEILPQVFEIFSPKSILDIGCGNGSWLKAAKDMGVPKVFGVDGIQVPNSEFFLSDEEFKVLDLSKPFHIDKKFELVLSLEVAEHIEEAAANIFIDNLTQHGDVILFSAAIPGQGGQYHLNEQWPQYWSEKFKKKGFVAYDLLREKFWDNKTVLWWYKQNILLFVKEKHPAFTNYKSTETPMGLVHPQLFQKKVFKPRFITNKKENFKLLKQAVKRIFK